MDNTAQASDGRGRREGVVAREQAGGKVSTRGSAARTDEVHGQEPPLLRDQLCFAVYSAAHAFVRRYKPLLKALDLTYPQFLCMMVLWEGDDQTVGEIGERLLLDSGTLTPLLKRLEVAGLVSRVRDRLDERQVRIQLTGKGRALSSRAANLPESVGCATGLSAAELIVLRERLLAIRNNLSTDDER